jgi:large subunit ribosomal protein L9
MENLKVVLLQRVSGLGSIGDVVGVKPGFARNYLLPKKIAMRATSENLKQFEERRAHIEAANAESRAEAQKIAEKFLGFSVTLIRQASEKGHLYGSVTCRDIAAAIRNSGLVTVTAGQINLHNPIKVLGVFEVSVDLHPEVTVPIKLNVAKSEEEAQQQILASNAAIAAVSADMPLTATETVA